MDPLHIVKPNTPGGGPGTLGASGPHVFDGGAPVVSADVEEARVIPFTASGCGPLPDDMSKVTVGVLRTQSNRLFALLDTAIPPDGAVESYERIAEELSARDALVSHG